MYFDQIELIHRVLGHLQQIPSQRPSLYVPVILWNETVVIHDSDTSNSDTIYSWLKMSLFRYYEDFVSKKNSGLSQKNPKITKNL